MQKTHYALLAGFLVAVAGEVGGLKNWHDALTPQFVSAAILQVGLGIGAMFADKPGAQPPAPAPAPVEKG